MLGEINFGNNGAVYVSRGGLQIDHLCAFRKKTHPWGHTNGVHRNPGWWWWSGVLLLLWEDGFWDFDSPPRLPGVLKAVFLQKNALAMFGSLLRHKWGTNGSAGAQLGHK